MPKNRSILITNRDWETLEAVLPHVQENHPMGMSIRNRATLASMAFSDGVAAMLRDFGPDEEPSPSSQDRG